ncbi:pentatricopeptide repeat-containing protein At5g57250, mitochondrial-like [Aristolochia californica]|uniref:pentatricopeptide repeat-containing protein At5g57250, mitochondrial-like n=1 Tax=Aristolochia californica TaxID=171875 RepID=UPI0035D6FC4E
MKKVNFKPNVITYTTLLNALWKEGRIQEAHDLFWHMKREGEAFDTIFFGSWIYGLFRERRLTEAFQKHKLMIECGIKPDAVSYTILIDGFAREGNVEKSIGFLNEMNKNDLKPNVVTYTAIMQRFIRRGKLKDAFSLFRKVEELGIEVDEITYTILIDGFCRNGDLGQVFHLLEEMEEKRISCGMVTYNTVINGLCKLGRTHEADMMSKGITGDNFMYTTLMHGYMKERNMTGVLEVKKRLAESGLVMDIPICNVLIKVLFTLGAFEDAFMLFKRLPQLGLVASSVTYCTIIDGCLKLGRISEGLEIFDEYKKTSLGSSGATGYNFIIGVLCREGMVEMASALFFELRENGLPLHDFIYMKLMDAKFNEGGEEGIFELLHWIEQLDSEKLGLLYNDAISFLCKKGCHYAASDVYFVMRRRGILVTNSSYYLILKRLIHLGNLKQVQLMLTSYLKEYGILDPIINKLLVHYMCKQNINGALQFLNYRGEGSLSALTAILYALTRQGRVQLALELVLEAEGMGMVLDVVVYSVVVDGLCKEGCLKEALDLCERMRAKGVHPNIVTYNSVINGLCHEGCLVQAFRLFDSLEKISVLPSVATYSTLIDAVCKEGLLQDANELYKRMVLKGLIPNTRVYNSLINGNCNYGLIEQALDLVIHMEESGQIPDAFTVSSVLGGYSVKGDMEAALAFFGEYRSRGILPDFLGFLTLVRGLFTKGRMEEARTIMKEMLQSPSIAVLIDKAGNEIEIESLTHFLDGLADRGIILEAINVLDEVGSMVFPLRRPQASCGPAKMKKTQRMGNQESTEAQIRKVGVCQLDEAESGSEDSYHLVRNFSKHNFEDWYSFISSLCSKGEIQKANRVAKHMLQSLGGTIE